MASGLSRLSLLWQQHALLLILGSAPAASGSSFDYDVFVVGGGSGGIACAKEAASLGAKVGICDFVRPSARGSTWGLGGTCVNVGCIPKKLMHRAGQLRHVLDLDASAFGYELPTENDGAEVAANAPPPRRVRHSWSRLVEAVQLHVRSLNFGYRAALTKVGVKYFNAKGSLHGGHEVALLDAKGRRRMVRARHIVLATGGRPRVPESFEGAAELAITSDDLFSLRESPGKTLVVGGGYVALECAGFLASLGHEVTVLLRSIPLRGFDEQCASLVLGSVEAAGATVLRGATPLRARRDAASGRIHVEWRQQQQSEGPTAEASADYDTVLVATGRAPESDALNLTSVGLETRADGKLDTMHETTSVGHVHAIGDLASEAPRGRPELTPVAARAGVLLARRLCGTLEGASERAVAAAASASAARCSLEPETIATAVFSPLEYACVGLSEEAAREALGDERLESYLLEYTPLEWAPVHERMVGGKCLVKILCDRDRDELVVGLHVVGDHAAEIMQGFALAVRLGATKADIDNTIGIHPSSGEEIVSVKITRRSGDDPAKAGC